MQVRDPEALGLLALQEINLGVRGWELKLKLHFPSSVLVISRPVGVPRGCVVPQKYHFNTKDDAVWASTSLLQTRGGKQMKHLAS